MKEAAQWVGSVFVKILKKRSVIFQNIFQGKSGVCVIHGDTLSTLLGLITAKRAGVKVCHLEAGLRSRNLFHPFPEEILRITCMKYSDHLAAPTDWAYENLKAMGYEAKAFRTSGNTGAEALDAILNRLPAHDQGDRPFALVSIHRFETIMSRRRLKALVDFMGEIASKIALRFVLHEPTERCLSRYGLLSILRDRGIELMQAMDYPDFLQLLQAAEFVVTDGGSVQEECAYLGKPCLLFRKRTERIDGLGENVCLSGLNPETLRAFVREYPRYRRPPAAIEERPSDTVIDFLLSRGYA